MSADYRNPLAPLFEQWTEDSAAQVASPAAAAETAPTGSAAPPAVLPVGLPPSTEEAVDLARAVAHALRRSESRAVKLAMTCGQLRAAMLRAAELLAAGNPAGAEAELRAGLEVGR